MNGCRMTSDPQTFKTTMPDTPWGFRDLLIVCICIFVVDGLLVIAAFSLLGDKKMTELVSRFGSSLLMLFLPLFWIRKKFGLSKEALGLRGRKINKPYVILGLAIAAAIMGRYFIKHGYGAILSIMNSMQFTDLNLVPLCISGFGTVILAPVSEEIMVRGFVYGYFRKRLGIPLGLISQALFFGLLHYGLPVTQIFLIILIGVVYGYLYERTGNIYSSMIWHGAINFSVVSVALLAAQG